LAINFHEKEAFAGIKNKNNLKRWLKELILREKAKPGQINIIITTDRKLLDLNRKFLSRENLTDIITFDYTENQDINGDLFISIQRVKENADIFGVSFQQELKRVMAHGILHLLGYKDGDDKEKVMMRKMEDQYLEISPEI
jgi:probable rRNA maturation factor